MRAMVMAAGAGTRLHPLTEAVPKPMVPIANRPVLEYTLENLARHGITELTLNLHSFPDMMRNHFKSGDRWGVHIQYSYEPKLMGTAGGVKKAESFLKGGPFLVMSGDGLTDIDLTDLIAFHHQKKSIGTIALKEIDTRFEYGVTLTNGQGRIARFIEKPNWSDVFSNRVNTGIYVFEASVLQQIPSRKPYDFGHELWPRLLKRRSPIFGKVIQRYWCDIGNLSEYRKAQRDILDGTLPYRLPGRTLRSRVWVDESSRLPSGVKLEGPVLIGRNARIESGARLGPYTVIGDNARIGRKSVLRHTTLWNNVRVGRGVTLENCVLGHRSEVSESIYLQDGNIVTLGR